MEVTNENSNNVKLYPIYKMLSWDLLFYMAIIFLFFTQIKGLSAADVLLADSIYLVFRTILLIPLTIFIERIGKRRSLIIGNMFNALSILMYIIANNFTMIIIGELFSAIAFNIKGVCETNILYDSLNKDEKRGERFSKIDGRATSLYYYIEAFSSAVSGFLFAINGYIPMYLCLIINIIAVILSSRFQETENIKEKRKGELKREIKEMKNANKDIFKSARLRNLIMFGAFFSGVVLSLTSLRSSILKDINIQPQYFGIIIAAMEIISGISAKNQNKFHTTFRNRTLSVLAIPVTISCIFLGLWCNIPFDFTTTLVLVLIVFAIQYISKGPFYTLLKKYLNNFTHARLRARISSVYNMQENILRAMICLFASFLLRNTTTANTFVIIGCISSIIVILMLDNMRKVVGLKPEEYKESDIKILELK